MKRCGGTAGWLFYRFGWSGIFVRIGKCFAGALLGMRKERSYLWTASEVLTPKSIVILSGRGMKYRWHCGFVVRLLGIRLLLFFYLSIEVPIATFFNRKIVSSINSL